MKAFLAAALLSLAVFATPALADPSGTYKVKGVNPGGDGTYDGSVTISKHGDTFKVVWDIDGKKTIGTAVGNDDVLSIGYADSKTPGVGLYVFEKGEWNGVWAYLGNEQLGKENWTK